MSNLSEITVDLILESDESSIVVCTAARFGFAPTRDVWFRYTHFDYYEYGIYERFPDPADRPPVCWTSGWRDVGPVTDEEAIGMKGAIEEGIRWLDHGHRRLPRNFTTFPEWNWEGLDLLFEERDAREVLAKTARFLEHGAFVGSLRDENREIVLSR